MRSIDYPNDLADLAVVGFLGPERVGFTIRPLASGKFRLLVWPEGMPDPALVLHAPLEFSSPSGPPLRVAMRLASPDGTVFPAWCWALVPFASDEESMLDDLARAAFGVDAIARGSFLAPRSAMLDEVRCVAWSCHQPYEEKDGRAVMGKDAMAVLQWYADGIATFKPHVIWGAGDSAYSDGTEATDLSGQVYDKGGWYRSEARRAWLKLEYRSMYRHFWSIAPMRQVMAGVPHLFIWDDHEIHDGWGSEGRDFERGNLEMFRIASEVANEYILNAGPRVRPNHREAHQAYVLGPMASFVFDTRSTRNYGAPRDRVISRAQLQDFEQFLSLVRANPRVTHLVTNTTVPLVGLREWVTTLATRAPDFLNDYVIGGIRDDVRDGWTSPGNRSTLQELLRILRRFMLERPDVQIINVSGDIHVGNGFEIHVEGAPRPIFQLTSSAITNRVHPPGIVGSLADIGDATFIEGVGFVRRIWETVTDPNFLAMRIGGGRAEFTLKVWDADDPDSKDLDIVI